MDNSPVGGLTFRAPSPTSSGIGSITKRPHCSPSAPMLLHMDHHQQQQKRNTDELEAAVRHQLRLPPPEGSSPPLGSGSPPRDGLFLRAKRLRTGDVSCSPSAANGPVTNSPQQNSLTSTMGSSGGWMNEALKSELLRFFSQGRRQNSPETSTNYRNHNNQTLFTEEQVVQICERLLREQRSHMERDFQRILNQKLADQYDAFRRFTQDQVHRQMQEKREDGSYFS